MVEIPITTVKHPQIFQPNFYKKKKERERKKEKNAYFSMACVALLENKQLYNMFYSVPRVSSPHKLVPAFKS